MSGLVVAVKQLEQVVPHPNADALDLGHIGGWQVVLRKGAYRAGDRVVYFPPDTVLPEEWTERFGVTRYCSPVRYLDYPAHRIRCTRLRGEPSFGLVVGLEQCRPPGPGPESAGWDVGADVAAHFNATKYLPPIKDPQGDVETPNALFVEYTDIENLRHFPEALRPGERVVLTEKIHGSNARVGVVEGEIMAGSHRLRRRRPAAEYVAANRYWLATTLPGVQRLLDDYATTGSGRQLILFGEVYGHQKGYGYGAERGQGFRAFDLLVEGQYLDYARFCQTCDEYGIERVPEIATIEYSLDEVKRLAPGAAFTGGHAREGVVVRPLVERRDPTLGRVVLKYVNDGFLLANQDEDVADA